MSKNRRNSFHIPEVKETTHTQKPLRRSLSLEQINWGTQETKKLQHEAYETNLANQEMRYREELAEFLDNHPKNPPETKLDKRNTYVFKHGNLYVITDHPDKAVQAFRERGININNGSLYGLKAGDKNEGIERVAIDKDLLEKVKSPNTKITFESPIPGENEKRDEGKKDPDREKNGRGILSELLGLPNDNNDEFNKEKQNEDDNYTGISYNAMIEVNKNN